MTSVKMYRVAIDQEVLDIRKKPITVDDKNETIRGLISLACNMFTDRKDQGDRAFQKNKRACRIGEEIFEEGEKYHDFTKEDLDFLKDEVIKHSNLMGIAQVRVIEALERTEEIDYGALKKKKESKTIKKEGDDTTKPEPSEIESCAACKETE